MRFGSFWWGFEIVFEIEKVKLKPKNKDTKNEVKCRKQNKAKQQGQHKANKDYLDFALCCLKHCSISTLLNFALLQSCL